MNQSTTTGMTKNRLVSLLQHKYNKTKYRIDEIRREMERPSFVGPYTWQQLPAMKELLLELTLLASDEQPTSPLGRLLEAEITQLKEDIATYTKDKKKDAEMRRDLGAELDETTRLLSQLLTVIERECVPTFDNEGFMDGIEGEGE